MTEILSALRYEGDGEFRAVSPFHRKRADEAYVVGEVYSMSVVEQRSGAAHRRYMAMVTEGWQTLPEHLAEQFPTPDSLRKWALIKAGYCDVTKFVASSKAEAHRIALFVRAIDPFSIVTVAAPIVTRFSAQSQSYKAMGKKQFHESADKVLDIIGEMIGADKSGLGKAA